MKSDLAINSGVHGSRLLRIDEVCHRLGCARSTVYQLSAAGCFTLRKRGAASLALSDEIDNYIVGLPVVSLSSRSRGK